MDDFYKKNKKFVIATGVAVLGLLGTGIYYLTKGIFGKSESNENNNNLVIDDSEVLSPWLKQYQNHIAMKLNETQNLLTIEILAFIVNFRRELEDYFLERNFPDLEKERISNLENESKYSELINKTLQARTETIIRVDKFVEKTFCHKMENIEKAVKCSEKKLGGSWNKIWNICNFPYDVIDLPKVTNEAIKQAYLDYYKEVKDNFKLIKNEMKLAECIPHYSDIAQEKIFKIQYRTQDRTKMKFGIDEKYLEVLINNREELLNDKDIKKMKESMLVQTSDILDNTK